MMSSLTGSIVSGSAANGSSSHQDGNMKDNYIHYNQMMDDSKQTEGEGEADISRSDFTETHSQDTIRNFQRVSDLELASQIETMDLRKAVGANDGYHNLGDEDDHTGKRNRSPSKGKKANLASAYNINNISQNVFTHEEEKTHDLIKHHLYEDEEDEDDNQHQSNGKERRVHTDGGASGAFDQLQATTSSANTTEKKHKKQPSKIGTFSMKPHLPQLKINVPMALSSNEIFEVFTTISKNQRFQIIEMEQNIATAVNKEPFSIKRMFMRCLPFQDFKRENPQNDSFISAIRLQIHVNEVKCCRKIALKGLYGEPQRLQEFSNAFRQRVHDIVSQMPDKDKHPKSTKNSNQIGNLIQLGGKRNIMAGSGNKIFSTMGNRTRQNNYSDDDSDGDGQKGGSYNETSSIYQIHKILSSDQYTLGKNVAQYIEAFHQQYKSVRESAALLPQPMEGILGLVNETVHAFHSEYNLGKETAKSLVPYCRPAVEKYLFQKLYDKLFAMYAIKNEEEDRLFIERSGVIKRMKPQDVMLYLGIRDKFIQVGGGANENQYTSRASYLINMMDQSKFTSTGMAMGRDSHMFKNDTDSKDNMIDLSGHNYDSHRSELILAGGEHQSIFNNSSTSSTLNLGPHHLNKAELPYIDAIRCIEKIQSFSSPREKLLCLSEAFGCLKTAIVDHWKGKLELTTMDDVLPLTIYAVAMAELSHPSSEFTIMEDYLHVYDRGLEFEKKLLTNFDVSIKYVNHEWVLPS